MGQEITGVPGGARFPSTRHSLFAAAKSDDLQERRAALDLLITAYWKPAYKYVRLKWRRSPDDARDLTQSFFTRAVEKDLFDKYNASKSAFRTYVRLALDGFVANEIKASLRQKRGGGAECVSLDFDGAENELARVGQRDDVSPEELFHREWVRSIFSLALERLRSECEARGRRTHFELFRRYDLDDGVERVTYWQLAQEFALPASAVTNYLSLARREFRRILLDVLKELTANDREFRQEVSLLLGMDAR